MKKTLLILAMFFASSVSHGQLACYAEQIPTYMDGVFVCCSPDIKTCTDAKTGAKKPVPKQRPEANFCVTSIGPCQIDYSPSATKVGDSCICPTTYGLVPGFGADW